MEERRWNEEGVEGTDADQCMSSCSFWSLGLLLPALVATLLEQDFPSEQQHNNSSSIW